MFQSFDESSNPAQGAARVAQLRRELARLGLDGFLVPREDEHQGEYVPARGQRLGWLTGFTGSAGVALILADKAIIFVDGRYHLQVRQQTDGAVFSYEDLMTTSPAKWLDDHGAGLKIGFDPWLHTIRQARDLRHALEDKGGALVALAQNPLDRIWADQPEPPLGAVSIQPLEFAGKPAEEKLDMMRDTLEKHGVQATILTDPASVAWVFNIRGRDVANTPLPLSFALISTHQRPQLFIDERKLNRQVIEYLAPLCQIEAPHALEEVIVEQARSGNKILLDENLAAEKLRLLVEEAGGKVVFDKDPARLPRAVKNTAELDGARRAHERDGVALVRFFAWCDAQAPGTQDEISLAQKLEQYRFETAEKFGSKLEDLSFDTISGSGANGAIIHYRVTKKTNRILQEGELYLVDSGAQYRDGTTDVTRTIACGRVGEEERGCFTRVLKGMIAISMAHFPAGSRGVDLDVLARHPLWQAGLDYAHGTGHGVGSYLSVHEGPQTLSRAGLQPLLAGMILSEGAFGIRIENLLIVTEPQEITGGERPMHRFETLTLCPIDRRLIIADMLTAREKDWLNAYHARIFTTLSPHLDAAEKAWLKQATAAI